MITIKTLTSKGHQQEAAAQNQEPQPLSWTEIISAFAGAVAGPAAAAARAGAAAVGAAPQVVAAGVPGLHQIITLAEQLGRSLAPFMQVAQKIGEYPIPQTRPFTMPANVPQIPRDPPNTEIGNIPFTTPRITKGSE